MARNDNIALVACIQHPHSIMQEQKRIAQCREGEQTFAIKLIRLGYVLWDFRIGI